MAKSNNQDEFDFSDANGGEGDSLREMVRRTDPETSHEAAEAALKDKTRSQRECKERIIEILTIGYFGEGMTITQKEFREFCLQVTKLTPSRAESLRRRFTDLERRGDIQVTGGKRDGAQVYRLNAHMD